MKPKDRTDNQHDLFRSRLDQQIDLNHPLVRAAAVIPWEKISDEDAILCVCRAWIGS